MPIPDRSRTEAWTKGVFAAPFADDEAKALLGVEPLHRAGFLDGGLVGGTGTPPDMPDAAPARRRAAVDAEDLGNLRAFLSGRHPHFERFARLHRIGAAALEDAGMEERVARAVGQFDEAEAPFGLEPFDDGAHRRAGRGIEPRGAEAWRAAKTTLQVRVIAVIVEIAAARLAKIPVSDQVRFLSSWFAVQSGTARRLLFQKIAPDASG